MIKEFQNPKGYWEHQGGFSVELTDDADISIVPSSGVSVSEKTVTVDTGRIKQVMGGIQLFALEQPFYWGYPKIKCIRDGTGNLLWVNYNYRKEILR